MTRETRDGALGRQIETSGFPEHALPNHTSEIYRVDCHTWNCRQHPDCDICDRWNEHHKGARW